jgi:transcriptional regulator with XRE-family HTH domain
LQRATVGPIVAAVETRQEWSARVAVTVGRQVAHYRTLRRLLATADGRELTRPLTLQELSDRCARLGYRIARSVISKLEKGHRQSITVDEVCVLAQALEVPPVLLLFPLGLGEAVEALPGREVDPWAAIEWFAGNSEDPADPSAPPQLGTDSPIVLWWQHRLYDGEIPVMWRALQDEISAKGQAGYPLRRQVAIPLRALIRIREVMQETGLTPPPLHPETARILGDVERGGGYVQAILRKEMDELARPHPAEDLEADDGAR